MMILDAVRTDQPLISLLTTSGQITFLGSQTDMQGGAHRAGQAANVVRVPLPALLSSLLPSLSLPNSGDYHEALPNRRGLGNPTPHYVSPNIGNYRVGRGFLKMQLAGDATSLDMGNCTQFEFQVKPTLLPHFSSRVGVRIKDYVAVTELGSHADDGDGGNHRKKLRHRTARHADGVGRSDHRHADAPLIYAASTSPTRGGWARSGTCTSRLVILSPAKATSLIARGAAHGRRSTSRRTC